MRHQNGNENTFHPRHPDKGMPPPPAGDIIINPLKRETRNYIPLSEGERSGHPLRMTGAGGGGLQD